jgi:succinyl-CoA synthetase beta subunit
MRDQSQEDPREAQAAQWELNYVALDGNIGCMVNGAGLAWAPWTSLSCTAANRLTSSTLAAARQRARNRSVQNHLSDDNVKAVLVNIFGGIVRCDLIADGIIGAVAEVGVNVPVGGSSGR